MNAVTDKLNPDTESDPSANMPSPLLFSDSAANKVKQLIEEEGNPELKLRVFVTGGGCSGFQYAMDFEKDAREDDLTLEQDGVKLYVDPMSHMYLQGVTIDYVVGVQGAAAGIVQGAIERGISRDKARFFPSSADAAPFIADLLQPGDLLLVKGSRGVKMERIVEAVRKRFALASGQEISTETSGHA